MTGRRAVWALLAALALLVPLTTGVAPAAAHVKNMVPPVAAAQAVADVGPNLPGASLVAAEPPGPAWIVVLALAASLALGRRRPRRVLALGLVLVLSFFAFEGAIHSVHHLGSPDRATRCPIASAATQTTGTVVEPVDVLPALILAALAGAPVDDRGPATRAFGAVRDRAPPVLA
jgi:hypothetical protein